MEKQVEVVDFGGFISKVVTTEKVAIDPTQVAPIAASQ